MYNDDDGFGFITGDEVLDFMLLSDMADEMDETNDHKNGGCMSVIVLIIIGVFLI